MRQSLSSSVLTSIRRHGVEPSLGGPARPRHLDPARPRADKIRMPTTTRRRSTRSRSRRPTRLDPWPPDLDAAPPPVSSPSLHDALARLVQALTTATLDEIRLARKLSNTD